MGGRFYHLFVFVYVVYIRIIVVSYCVSKCKEAFACLPPFVFGFVGVSYILHCNES